MKQRNGLDGDMAPEPLSSALVVLYSVAFLVCDISLHYTLPFPKALEIDN